MTIAVASGKGGTGKTTVALALALSAEGPVSLLDCDVEEPNTLIFLEKRLSSAQKRTEAVYLPVPVVDETKCTGCGLCAKFCKFNAMACLGGKLSIFADLCHSCGGCVLVCPHSALKEETIRIGEMNRLSDGRFTLVEGVLDTGKALAVPIIRAVRKAAPIATETCEPLVIADCPPGASCPMVSAVKGSDHVVLVSEPTPFGLNDLKIAVETLRQLSIPLSLVINRCDSGDTRTEEWAHEEGIPIVARIPTDRRIAQIISNGGTLLDVGPEWSDLAKKMLKDVLTLAADKKKSVKADTV
jgi:MinD superfamily P-loop ATPase